MKIDAFAVDTAYAVTVNGETVVPTLYLGSKELVVTYTLDEMPAEDVVMEIKTITNFFDMGDGYGKLTTTGVDYICYYVEGTPSRAGVPGGVTTKTDGSYWNFTFKNGDVTIDMPFVVSGTKLLFREALPQDVVDKANNTPGVFRASGKPVAVSTISFEDGDVTAAVDETTGKIEEINFKLGAPKAEGALLPETIVLDGNVEATIVWKDAKGNVVTGETAVAPLSQYTYEATLKAAASTEATFADTVKVTTQKGTGVNVPNFAEDGAEVKDDGTVVTAPTPIEAITVNVSGKLSANAVPSFEIPTSPDYKWELSEKSPADGSIMADKTYTWTVTITSRENKNVKLTADTKITLAFGETGLTENDVTVGAIDEAKGTFTLSVRTKAASAANDGTKQIKWDSTSEKYKFYAYMGPDGKDKVTPMDAVEIAEAISAQDTGNGDLLVSYQNVNIANGTVETDKKQTLNFAIGNTTDGDREKPIRLFKVTKPDGTVTYVESEGVLTGLGDIVAVVAKGTNVGSSNSSGATAWTTTPGTVNGKKVTLGELEVDTAFVEALPLKNITSGAINVGTNTKVATVKIAASEGQAETALNASSSEGYIAKGAVVKIEFEAKVVDLKGQDIEFKVNGKVVATGKYNNEGVLTLDGENAGKKFIEVAIDGVDTVTAVDADKDKVTFEAASGMTVTLDGVTLTPDTEGKYTLPTLAGGLVYVKTTTTLNSDGTTSETYTKMDSISNNKYTTDGNDKDSLDGVIRLKTAFEMKYSSKESDDFALYAAYDGKALKDTDKFSTNAKYIPVGNDGTATVWVAAKSVNTEIVVAENKEEDVSAMTLVVGPTMFGMGLWEVTVTGAVNESTFAAGLQLPAKDAEDGNEATYNGAAVSVGNEIVFEVAGLKLKGATVTSVAWEDGTEHAKLNETVKCEIGAGENPELLIKATAAEAIGAAAPSRADGDPLGTVRVTIRTASGLDMEGVYLLKATISSGGSSGGGSDR